MTLFYKNHQQDPEQRTATPLTKAVSLLVIGSLLNVISLPAQAIIQQEQTKQTALDNQPVAGQDAYEKLVNLNNQYQLQQQNYQAERKAYLQGRSIYRKMVDGITQLFTNDAEKLEYDPKTLAKTQQKLSGLQAQLATEQQSLHQELQAQTQQLQKTGNQTALAQQQQLEQELDKRYQTVQSLVANVNNASDEASQNTALTALNQQITQWQPKKAQTDMHHLPWGMPDNKVRAPVVKDGGVQPASFSLDKTPHSAIHQWRNTEYKIGQYLLNHNPVMPIAAVSGMTEAGQWAVLNALPAQVQSDDLGESDDVQITQAIKDKAKALDNNPAKIYKWVHDNIEYVPSYGSIQGSDYTLQTLRGNDADTASLLIALLRASNVPARYVYGTVDIPAKQAMDWVGGVNNMDAAQNLLGQGGIPNTVLMNGSEPKYLRLEHVWVEANVNALPAKGSISANAVSPSNWLPLDASYKSYVRTAGIDIAKAVPFDAQKLIDQAKTGATIDDSTGSVKNLNQDAVNTAISNYQTQVQAYLQQNYPSATVGDVLGTSKIKEYKSQFLSPVLPYQVQTVISDYQKLPDTMKSYFVVNVYQSIDEKNNSVGMGDDPSFHVRIPTTKLQGKPLAVSFKGDDQVLQSYLPKPDANGNIDPSQLPRSLPSSVRMTAEVSLDGQVLQSGNSYSFGSEVFTQLGFERPQTNVNYTTNTAENLSNKTIRAGEYHAIGYDMQGLSQQQLEKTKTTLETVKGKLDTYQKNKDLTALAGITKHDVTGAMLQATVQSYFAINDTQDSIAQKQAQNIVANRFMSYGTFHTFVKPIIRYGISFGGTFTAMQMDIDRLMRTAVAKDNNLPTLANFNVSQGARQSANEHLVPEQLFNDPNATEKSVEGVSAVKALQIAAQQGQTIYTITQDNYAQILPKLSLSSGVMSDIQNAINAGKQVTVHEKNISYKNWTGSGYVILDPITGTGAYLIDGGANGGFIDIVGNNSNKAFLATTILGFFLTLGGTVLGTISAPIFLLALATIFVVGLLATFYTNLQLMEAGCSDTSIKLNWGLQMSSFMIGAFMSTAGETIFASIAGFIYTSALTSDTVMEGCSYLRGIK